MIAICFLQMHGLGQDSSDDGEMHNEVNYVTHGPQMHRGPNGGGPNGPHAATRTTVTGGGTRTETIGNNNSKDPDLYNDPGVQRLWDNKALLVDVVSRIFFPFSFAVFNAFYWGLYAVPVDDILHL